MGQNVSNVKPEISLLNMMPKEQMLVPNPHYQGGNPKRPIARMMNPHPIAVEEGGNGNSNLSQTPMGNLGKSSLESEEKLKRRNVYLADFQPKGSIQRLYFRNR